MSSTGITLIEPDGQPELPDQYSGMSFYQNMGEEREALEALEKKKITRLGSLINWDAIDGEESVFHPAEDILEEAEKLHAWLAANEDWDEFDFGREGFLMDLGELLEVLRYSVPLEHSFSLDFC